MISFNKLIFLLLFLHLFDNYYAQIEYYDFIPDTVITVYESSSYYEEFYLDINGDLIDDIRFYLKYQSNIISPHWNEEFYFSVYSVNGKNMFGGDSSIITCSIKGLLSGDTIGENISWTSSGYFLFKPLAPSACNEFETECYLAFTDTLNGQCHFGWILIKSQTYYGDVYYPSYARLTVYEYAYNLEPNHSIIAGDTIISIDPSSINIPVTNNKPIVYPNPTSGNINIDIKENRKITVFNSFGSIILETEEKKVDLSNQPVGLYFLRINSGNKFIIEKILKK